MILYFLPYNTEWFGFSDFKESVLFFVIGMVWNFYKRASQNAISNTARILRIVGGTTVSILMFHSFRNVKMSMLFTAIIMIFVSWNMAELVGESSICKWISRNNFTIYIYSWPFQAVTMVIAGKMGFPWYLMSLSMFVVGMAAPILMVSVYKKFKVVNNRFFDLMLGMK